MGCRRSFNLSLAGSAVGSIAGDCRRRIVELLWIEGAEQAEPESFLLLLGAICPALRQIETVHSKFVLDGGVHSACS